jgi:hypothetical protein
MSPTPSDREPSRRRCGIFGVLLQLLLLYVLLVFGGGTLINTGHPVAVEAGRLMHTVTLVEPSIRWAESAGRYGVAKGLRVLAAGVDLPKIT